MKKRDTGRYWPADEAAVKGRQQYGFIIANRDRGKKLWKSPSADSNTPDLTRSTETDASTGTDIIREVENYSTPLQNEAIIYEIHIGSFLFDPALPDPHATFNSLISKLDYLKDLGINVIEIMAPGELVADSSWGYNHASLFAMEYAYGGPTGFRNLVREAHKRGIAVIFEVVYNHIGPGDRDLCQFDSWSEDNQGGIYLYNDEHERRQTPGGTSHPHHGWDELRQYLLDNALRWLEQYQVDGICWDTTGWRQDFFSNNKNPNDNIPDGWSLMQYLNNEIHSRQPLKFNIARGTRQGGWLTRETGAGGAGFTAEWDAEFIHSIRAAIVPPDDASRDIGAIQRALENRYNNDAFKRVIYTESHEEDANGHARLPEEICPGKADDYFSRKRSTLGAALVFTAPGIPMIFQGQEFLEDHYFLNNMELDWSKARRYSGILKLYRDLIRLRRNWFNTTRGLCGQSIHVHHRNDSDKLIAFHRWGQGGAGDDVVIVANFANRAFDTYTIGFPREGSWKVRFNSDWSGYSPDFGNQAGYDTVAILGGRDNMLFNGNIGIGPYSVLILSQ